MAFLLLCCCSLLFFSFLEFGCWGGVFFFVGVVFLGFPTSFLSFQED